MLAATSTTSTPTKAQRVAVASHGSQAPPPPTATPTATTAPTTTTSGSSTRTTPTRDETIQTTANHPWLTADRGWAQAGSLRLGERVVRADGSAATVVALHDVAGTAPMYDLTVSRLHDFAVGSGAYVVHNNSCGTDDLHAFGNKAGPRPVRPGNDIAVDDSGMVKAQTPPANPGDPLPTGASTFIDPEKAGLTGAYHRLPAGTDLPGGLGIYADGADVGGPAPWGHRTIYPTRAMPFDEFDQLFRGLPWTYGGKIK